MLKTVENAEIKMPMPGMKKGGS